MAKTETLSCGHAATPDGVAAGYATLPNEGNRNICYACADDRHRAELTDTKKTGGYLSSDKRTITTWTGGKLMTVTRVKTARVGFPDVTGRRPVRYFLQATDVHGQIWKGTSPGPGMYVRMRRG